MPIAFITGSDGKFREAEAVWPGIVRRDIALPEIQSLEPKAIIRAKLAEALKLGAAPCFVEDTSLTVTAWNGLPGPLIKWFLESLGVEGLAKLVLQSGTGEAAAQTVIGFAAAAGAVRFAAASVRGRIVAPRGGGFGWDSIFEPEGSQKTFGEMSAAEKAGFSMRVKALRALGQPAA